jgi:hypothetical protein
MAGVSWSVDEEDKKNTWDESSSFVYEKNYRLKPPFFRGNVGPIVGIKYRLAARSSE